MNSSGFCGISRWLQSRLAVVIAMVASGVFSGIAAETPPTSGKSILLAIEGRVEVARSGSLQWAGGAANQELAPGDRVRTGLKSRATLQLADLSVLRLNQLTVLEIKPPQAAGDKAGLDLKSGSTYFFNRERPGTTGFQTPSASGAIRGTEFHLAVDDAGGTVVTMLDGEVLLAAEQGSVSLKSGEEGSVAKGGAPKKTPVLNAINVIQWALYYPAVLNPDDLALGAAVEEKLTDSLKAYRAGDLLTALAAYPEGRVPANDGERAYYAGLLLGAGRVDDAEAELAKAKPEFTGVVALRELVAAVKNQKLADDAKHTTASEWLAHSYYLQSRGQLTPALAAAKEAAKLAPQFGAALVRQAELEFGFGHTREMQPLLERALELSPRNAQAMVLQGFALSARGRMSQAAEAFDRAVAIDPALGNAWLGRGLVKIRGGKITEGRADLQVAATLEPQRSLLRSYLGKAWAAAGNRSLAEKEFNLAQTLDPADPTPWLYSALLKQQENRINEGIADLERSKALNDNRSVFRSEQLLDQDRAMRSANLAALYRDAGMADFGTREAASAVAYDYANYSAHLFLAENYDAQRDQRTLNLRFETPFFSELLLAQLLAPVGAGNLSQNISQQEYSRFFEGRGLGVFSSTEYLGIGDWAQSGSQFGTIGNTAYSIDAFYRSQNGQRINNEREQRELSLRVKQQITSQDSVFLQVTDYKDEAGDLIQYYNPAQANSTIQTLEKQRPNAFLGYHHEWSPGVHTLFLGGRLHDDFMATNSIAPTLTLIRNGVGTINNVVVSPVNPNSATFRNGFNSEFVTYSAELQQIWQTEKHTLIMGGRYQNGDVQTTDLLDIRALSAFSGNYLVPASLTNVDASLERASGYLYYHWQIAKQLQLIGGLTYDHLVYPQNTDYSPISAGERDKDQVSPKLGAVWSPLDSTTIRAAYTKSLGGLFFDNSVRLEPTQVAGFTQAYRSLVPESVSGPIAGAEFETIGIALDQKLWRGGYLGITGETLRSDADRTVGAFQKTGPLTIVAFPFAPKATVTSTRQSLSYEENTLRASFNQLLGDEWALGATYRFTYAQLTDLYLDVPSTALNNPSSNRDATLQQVNLTAIYNHRCGFFGRWDSLWSHQVNSDLPSEAFWQHNVYVGYRFLQRRVEARVGILNLTDQDYRLNPLTLYSELMRQRTFIANFRFMF